MLKEAPVGYADTRRAKQASAEMMASPQQGRPVGGGGGEQPNAIPNPEPLPRLRNNAAVRQGAAGHAATSRAAANTGGTVNAASPGAFGTEFDREVTTIDPGNPEAMHALLLRMNQAIADNQGKLDIQNKNATRGLSAPDQDKLGVRGGNLGKQRHVVQRNQLN